MIPDPCCAQNIDGVNRCESDPFDYTGHLQEISPWSISFGFIMFFGTMISDALQIHKLYQRKSTEGISIHMLHLAAYNQWNTALSQVISQFSKLMACGNSPAQCWDNFFSLYQQIILIAGYFVNWVQYLYYEHQTLSDELVSESRAHKINIICFGLFLTYSGLTIPAIIVPSIYYGSCDTTLQSFGFVFNISAAVIACAEWIPQIVKTYQVKAAGSFSILSFAIQTPGVFVSLFVLVSSKTAWYSWLCTGTSCVLHAILLTQLLYYQFCHKKPNAVLAEEAAAESSRTAEETGEKAELLNDVSK